MEEVAAQTASPVARVTQAGVQVLWQQQRSGSPEGCNVEECAACPDGASRRWRVTVSQDPSDGGDSFACDDYSRTGTVSYQSGCLWSGAADVSGEPMTLFLDPVTNNWFFETAYADTTLSWRLDASSFLCCGGNGFGCSPTGFPCPQNHHPAPCATLTPFTALVWEHAAAGGVSTGGVAPLADSFAYRPDGSPSTGAYKSNLIPYGTGSPGSGNGAYFLDAADGFFVFLVTYANLTTPATAITGAHFYLGPPGTNGTVVRTLTTAELGGSAVPGGTMKGTWMATDPQPMTAERARQITEGKVYFAVNTAAFPDGEIRGQVIGRLVLGTASLNEPATGTGGAGTGGLADASVTSAQYNPEGGVTTGGSPLLAASWRYAATGGVTAGGYTAWQYYSPSGGATTGGVSVPVVAVAAAGQGGAATTGYALVAFNRGYEVSGGVATGGLAPATPAYLPAASGGVTAGGGSAPYMTMRFAASGGATAGGATDPKPQSLYRPSGGATAGGAVAVGSASYRYVPSSPRNRVFVFGNAAYGRDSYHYDGSGEVTAGGQGRSLFCDLPCDTRTRFYRDSEGNSGCKVVDPDTGRAAFVCARLAYRMPNSSKRRASAGAYVAAVTVCDGVGRVAQGCFRDQL